MLLWLNMFWLVGIVLILLGTVLLYENDGETPLLGGQIFCAILFLVSLAMGLLIYVIANDTRVSNGGLPRNLPMDPAVRDRVGLAWAAVAWFGAEALAWLWVAGLLMFPERLYPKAQRAWEQQRAREPVPTSRRADVSPSGRPGFLRYLKRPDR